MPLLVLPRNWTDLYTRRAAYSGWHWLRAHDLRPVAAMTLLAAALWIAQDAARIYWQFHTIFQAEMHKTPYGGFWVLADAVHDSELIAVGLFLVLALSAFGLTLLHTRKSNPRLVRLTSTLLYMHCVLIGTVFIALIGVVCVGNWPAGWYLQPPVGAALVMLLLTTGGLLWDPRGRKGVGWQSRLAGNLPLVHLAAVVLACWCVYSRTLGFVVDVIQ